MIKRRKKEEGRRKKEKINLKVDHIIYNYSTGHYIQQIAGI
ncbi:hypothetical protein [Okeania sp. KiyG1]|nr:hypothetical protein [Okeania sp. KiyG1]